MVNNSQEIWERCHQSSVTSIIRSFNKRDRKLRADLPKLATGVWDSLDLNSEINQMVLLKKQGGNSDSNELEVSSASIKRCLWTR